MAQKVPGLIVKFEKVEVAGGGGEVQGEGGENAEDPVNVFFFF